ncbi:tannase and feruloyl esterase [Thozetella sp. PMI_491]|nr:tannase and feruloyl esterase [Thozetella sp. PMI_491]
MMKLSSLRFASLLLPLGHLAFACESEQCGDLVQTLAHRLPNTTVRSAEYIKAGANLFAPATHSTCTEFNSTMPFNFCRVRMQTRTGPDSAVDFETWLPSNWTGRFLAVGNGGLGGCIAYSDMAYGGQRGFAVVGTNNGHDGNTGLPFFNSSGVLEDYAYRAVHTGVVIGKQATAAFYGQKHTRAYWLGCSTGGRQGFMEAQMFPNDFDGIVAGAPAFAFTSLMLWEGFFYTITGGPRSPTFISESLWSSVYQDIMKQCDGLDGRVDGIIEDPDLCQYRPESLICTLGQNTSCLTGVQAETVRRVFSPLYGGDGKMVYPRITPGTDSASSLWSGTMFRYSLEWLRYVVYKNPSWNGTIGIQDIEAALKVSAFGVDAFNGDLSEARRLGTKILHYHGLADPLISPENSARYYNHVSRTMQLPSGKLDDFYRFFRISGMAHCAGGPGATYIGNRATALAGEEPDRNVLAAIVEWVEKGKAPEYILGTALDRDNQTAFQRRHCKYPLRNVYSGSGDPNSADSWNCI